VQRILTILAAGVLAFAAGAANAAHTQTRLVLSATAARPGDTIMAGLELRMEPGWHTYWKNPGASGMATKIAWQLPPGVTAGEIQWPLPDKLPEADLTTYVYQGEVMLLVPLKLAPDLKPGALELKAKASWLECEQICVPGSANLTARIVIGSDTKPSPEAALIASWQTKLPKPADGLSARAWWEQAASGDLRPLILEWTAPAASKEADFFPAASDTFEVQPVFEIVSAESGLLRIRKMVKKFEGGWPKEISGVLVQQAGGERQGFAVILPVGNAPTGARQQSLWLMLFYAFVGGLILNIMPCVLPVIALKILGFVAQSKEEPRQVRKLGLIYAGGVLVSFLVLAGIVIGLKTAGHKAGWGMQFGSPVFVVCLTALVTLVALNLFGVFEINLGGRVMNAAGGLASRHGAAGAFFNGVLATVLATPCTAPFLGTALGFAFAETPLIVVLMFLTIGAGLTAPYVVLSWQPAWLKFLPQPGAWMEKFKIAMGFPMLATAVWLFLLAAGNLDKSRTLWFGLFLVALGLAAWIWGEFAQRGTKHRGLAMAVSILFAGGIGACAFCQTPDQIAWQSWSPAAVAQARAASRPVFVDFTADWCVTCQVNKRTSIEIPSVRAKLKEINAVALLGDYTRLPDSLTDELSRFGRAGVPLVLVYPKAAGEPPMVLPAVLTPGVVLEALEKAAR